MDRVLITGAAGRIGRVLRQGLRGRYATLRLADVRPMGEAQEGEEVVVMDAADLAAAETAMAGVDAVVHLAATAAEADWETLQRTNIVATYNAYEAARRQGVRRFVFASSIHVVGFYRRERVVGVGEPVRPDTRYGVTKVFGEALGRLYADKYGLGVVCVRIGSFQPRPADVRMLHTWISHRDMVEFTRVALEAGDIHFEVFYGVSNNQRALWRNGAAERFGYRPKDNAEHFAAEILARHAPEDEPDVARLFHGGEFCALEFAAEPDAID